MAFYLPQFHPIPENDEWWGTGLHRVDQHRQGPARFPGHYQPHVPADLGFYDLRAARDPRGAGRAGPPLRRRRVLLLALLVRRAPHPRAALRRGAGLRRARLPVRPGVGQPDLVGHLARRRRPHPDRADLSRARRRPARTSTRCCRPSPTRGTSRSTADRCSTCSAPSSCPSRRRSSTAGRPWPARPACPGCTWWPRCPTCSAHGPHYVRSVRRRLRRRRARAHPGRRSTPARARACAPCASWACPRSTAYARRARVRSPVGRPAQGRVLPRVYPNWDNTPRSRRRGLVAARLDARAVPGPRGRTPSPRSARLPGDERLLFVKSWNEWAEGNHLEPDQRHGHGYLEALAAGLGRTS